MNYSEEIAKLAKLAALQRDKGETDSVTAELTEGLLTIVKSLAVDYSELNERLKRNEEFAETISEDLYDIQSLAVREHEPSVSDLSGEDLAQFFARLNTDECNDHDDKCDCGCGHHHHEDVFSEDEDSDENSFVRCPFCNTLIFGNPTSEKFECPFCGGSFTREDME